MTRTIYLHIGSPKAGSSTLQRFFKANRDALPARGWIYPASLGDPASDLVLYALSDHSSDRMRMRAGRPDAAAIAAFRQDLTERFTAELQASDASNVLISHENHFGRLKTVVEMERLRELLASVSDAIKIVVYLRRQDETVLSRYGLSVANGSDQTFAFNPPVSDGDLWYDFDTRLDRWSQVFGQENLIVRRFGRPYFKDGDLYADFFDAIGMDGEGLERIAPYNSTTDAHGLEFMRLLNARLGDQAKKAPWIKARRALRRARAQIKEPHLGASAAEREAFCRQFQPTNDAVARRFFGEETLFTHPFPDDAPGKEAELTPDAAVAIAIDLIEWALTQ